MWGVNITNFPDFHLFWSTMLGRCFVGAAELGPQVLPLTPSAGTAREELVLLPRPGTRECLDSRIRCLSAGIISRVSGQAWVINWGGWVPRTHRRWP